MTCNFIQKVLAINNVVERGTYHLSTILVNCIIDGHEEGNFCLIMPENNNYCIHMGRDASGVPKVFADLPKPYLVGDGHTICETRSWGYDNGAQWQPFYGVNFGPMEKCSPKDTKKWEDVVTNMIIYATKVIPGNGAEPTNGFELFSSIKYKFLKEFKECWVGKEAEFYVNENLQKSLTMENRTVNALKNNLPVREVIRTIRWHGVAGDNPKFSFSVKHGL